MSLIWTEKYRPQDFSDIMGQKEIVKRVEAFVKTGDMPHQLYAGPPGVGKTTLALVVAKKIFGDSWKQNMMELNASDERGIDVIRDKVKNFARTRAIGDVPFKVIYLDECDALTREAQQALRRTMENYTQTCRFILSANYSSKIIEPIQSRCVIFRFKPIPKDEILKLIDKIAASEKIKVDAKGKEALYETSEGDCRRLENIMQSCSAITQTITDEIVYQVSSVAKPKEVMEFLTLALNNRFLDARKKLLDTMLAYGLSGLDIIRQIQREVWKLDTSDRNKLFLIEKCGDAEFRMVEGSDDYVQLEAFLAAVALAGSEEIKK